ncbi:hypothetical protein A7A76_02060, partial [Lysobacter enzymogenes]|uniref:hypothetical protein n=1 Tax=Lysobacter enzymogenes TaxID=69 RepID=UPI0019D0D850
GAHAASATPAASARDARQRRPPWLRAALVVAGLHACAPAAATQPPGASEWSGAVALSSQLVDRGVATTAPKPILQAAAHWTPGADWTLSLSAAAAADTPASPLQSGVAATRTWRLSERWRWRAGLSHSRYLIAGRHSWRVERNELQVGWQYQDRAALTLSATRLRGHARTYAALDLTWNRALTPQWSLAAGLGAAEIARYRDGVARSGAYGYGHLGLVWRRGRCSAELYRLAADSGAPRPWNLARAEPWALTLALAL